MLESPYFCPPVSPFRSPTLEEVLVHTAILEPQTRPTLVDQPRTLLDQVLYNLQVPAFTPSAVDAYKDAVERNAIDKATWLARTYRHLPNRLVEASAICTCAQYLCYASSMVLMFAWCVTVLQMMVSQSHASQLVWLSIGVVLSEFGTVFFQNLRKRFDAAWDEAQDLVWNVFDLSETLNPDIPNIGLRLTAKIRQALKGHVVAFNIHRLGPDPFLEVVHYDCFGNRFSAIYYGFVDSETELMEVDGRIVKAPRLVA